MPDVSKVPQAKSPPVTVDVFDKRTDKVVMTADDVTLLVGFKREFVPYNDMVRFLADAFNTELKDRGFIEGAGGTVISANLSFFRCDQMPDLPVPETAASIGIDVTVKRPGGSVSYSRFVLGRSEPWQKIHPPEENLKYPVTNPMQAAIQDALANVFSDPAFLDALKD